MYMVNMWFSMDLRFDNTQWPVSHPVLNNRTGPWKYIGEVSLRVISAPSYLSKWSWFSMNWLGWANRLRIYGRWNATHLVRVRMYMCPRQLKVFILTAFQFALSILGFPSWQKLTVSFWSAVLLLLAKYLEVFFFVAILKFNPICCLGKSLCNTKNYTRIIKPCIVSVRWWVHRCFWVLLFLQKQRLSEHFKGISSFFTLFDLINLSMARIGKVMSYWNRMC